LKWFVLYENSLTWLFASRKVQPSSANYAVLSPVRRKAWTLNATLPQARNSSSVVIYNFAFISCTKPGNQFIGSIYVTPGGLISFPLLC
jgi:hypothetical protein